jgi:hypothetical protein
MISQMGYPNKEKLHLKTGKKGFILKNKVNIHKPEKVVFRLLDE